MADVDKIRRAAVLAMQESVNGNDHLAYLYCAWINRHCQDLLYEEMYHPPTVGNTDV